MTDTTEGLEGLEGPAPPPAVDIALLQQRIKEERENSAAAGATATAEVSAADPTLVPVKSEGDKDKDKEKDKDRRDRDRDRDRDRHRDKESRERDRDRDRDRERKEERKDEKERDKKDDKERDRKDDKDREHKKDDKDREHKKDDKERDRHRDRKDERKDDREPKESKDKDDREKRDSRDRKDDKDRDRDRKDDKDRDRKDDKERDRKDDKDRDRHRDRDGDRRSRDRKDDKKEEKKEVKEESLEWVRRSQRPSQWDQMIASAEVMVPNPTMSGINPQIQRQQRKIYVGNLPRDITELELLEFFNTAMINANFHEKEGSPCVSASINVEKNFAFVEFRSPEEASRAMSFDGITLRGIALRVRRPKDFIPDDGAANQTAVAANLNIVSTNVADTPNKVFIGGLPNHLNEGDVKKLLSVFGQLRSFNLVRDTTTGNSKGYAFCEFADHSVTDMACAALNGMAVGDKNLVVQLASVDQRKKSLQTNPELYANVQVNQAAAAFLNLVTPASQILATRLPTPDQAPTKILVIMNMINITEYPGNKAEDDYQEFCDAVYEEISKYAKVQKMLVPRPPKMYATDSVEPFDMEKFKSNYDSDDEPDNMDPWATPGFGKVYVEFSSPEEARKAQTGLAGRRFDGRMIITSFLPEDKWERGLLEPEDESATAAAQGMQLLNETKQKELQDFQAMLNAQALEVAQADLNRLAR